MDKNLEQILVVPSHTLFTDGQRWSGFQPVTDFDTYYRTITAHAEFNQRGAMEVDPSYKQIIPYLVFMHQGSVFVMQRAATAGEQRLKNKYSLGIGGHIRQADLVGKSIFDWAAREFAEEINYQGDYTIEPIGLVNDEGNAVGQVHFGCVFVIHGDSDQIAIRAELKSGQLVPLAACVDYREGMETWSQYVFDFLLQRAHVVPAVPATIMEQR